MAYVQKHFGPSNLIWQVTYVTKDKHGLKNTLDANLLALFSRTM